MFLYKNQYKIHKSLAHVIFWLTKLNQILFNICLNKLYFLLFQTLSSVKSFFYQLCCFFAWYYENHILFLWL